MKITIKKLKDLKTCNEAAEEFINKWPKSIDLIDVIKRLIKINDYKHLQWANWLIARCMTYKQYVGYAVYAAKQVLSIFEKKYPNDKRPRKTIKATKK